MNIRFLLNRNNYLFIVILLGTIISAQTIITKGKIVDSENEGIPEVSITTKEGGIQTTTDIEGFFEIETTPEASIIIESIGFNDKEITASDSFQNITLISSDEGIIEDVVFVGTRSKGRTQIDTPVPVDILDIEELTSVAPQLTVSQILNYAAPSFSSNIQSGGDGTDHIDPATLRGLGPDQVLVLINGKRRHSTSLVNVNGTVGRGSTGIDMNAIPSNAIKRIEILRDGASAQYGSDAIAGVINIILKEATNELDVTFDTGANFTSEHGEDRDVDGETFNLGLNYGLPIGQEGGFINFTGQFESRGWTDRNGAYTGNVFNAYNGIERLANNEGLNLKSISDVDVTRLSQQLNYLSAEDKNIISGFSSANLHRGTEYDDEGNITFYNPLSNNVTDSELAARGQNRSDYNLRFGQSKTRGGKFFFNSVIPVSENAEIYGFGGMSYRNGEASAFYRLPNQSRTYTPSNINGFLPLITSEIKDQSLAVGIRGKLNEWDADFSNTWGKNTFDYTLKDSSNASLQNISPNELDAGGYAFLQNTTNFDLSRKYDFLDGFNLGLGAEYRFEEYTQNAGQEASYARYDINGDVVTNATPNDLYVTDFFGRTRAGGAQGFGGIAPNNAGSNTRDAIGVYADGELDITKKLLISGALRFENYSDFGSTLNFKVASRYKIHDNLAFRGAISSGFRAPSLHQINFTSTATNFDTDTGDVFEVGTFSNTSAIAQAFGIPQLQEEKSMSYSAGFTGKIPSLNMKVTLDGYYIGIKDRILLTENISRPDDKEEGDAAEELRRLFDQAGVERVRFFANTADTETMGLDLVVEQKAKLGTDTKLTSTFSATLSKTNVTDVNIPSTLTTEASNFFSNRSELIIEESTPRTKGSLSHILNHKNWSLFLRNSYFGEVTELSTRTNFTRDDGFRIDNTYGAKLITDLSVGYKFKGATFTVGANNIFDIYPEEADAEFTTTDRFPYSRNTQFGYGGRYLFARVNFKIK